MHGIVDDGSAAAWRRVERGASDRLARSPRVAEHADLDRGDVEILENRVDLRARRSSRRSGVDRADAERVLRGHRRDRARAVDAERGEGLEIGLDPRAAAGIRAGDRQRDRRPRGHGAPRRRDPFARARLRIGVQRDVGDDRRRCRRRRRGTASPRSMLSPPMATSGSAPTRRFHSPMPLEPLRREGHRLENRRKDRPERDIVGIERERRAPVRPRRAC